MTHPMTCSRCGSPFSKELTASVNVRIAPEQKAAVLSGAFFLAECPVCGTRQLCKFPFLYHDPDERLMIWLGADELTRSRAADVLSSTPEMQDYHIRLVDSPGELIEKIKIFDAGLEDIAVELCKFVTSQEAGEALPLKFMEIDSSAAELHFACPKDGKMDILAVGLNVYEDCCGILQRNPVLEEKAKGPVQIDQAWIEQYFG
ncbi:MAG: CpXC domain-containing protein [Bacteroidales bacterium]|nr:CpXC domain-containing protein [Bacteroidales bacterium]